MRTVAAMNRVWKALLPELRRLPEARQAAAFEAARATPLDLVELLGMAAGLIAVTALTRYGVDPGALSVRFGAALVNFVVALPLLALALAPFHWRRLRRGLREHLRREPA